MSLKKHLTAENVLLTALLLSSAILRLTGALFSTFAFTYDVGRDLLAAKNIVENLDIILIGPTTGLHGLFYGPWWYYFLTIPYLVSGGSPTAALIFIVAAGVLTVFLSFLLGKRIKDYKLGLIFASFVAFSQTMISLSQIWNPNVAPLYLVGVLLILEYLTNSKKRTLRKDIFLSIVLGALIGLSLDAEVVYGTLLFISLFFVYLLFFRHIFHPKLLLTTIAGILIILLPRIVFEVKNNFLMTKNIFNYLVSQDAAGSVVYSREIGEQFIDRLQAFFFLWRDTAAGGSIEIAIALLPLLFFTFIFTSKKIEAKQMLFVKISTVIVFTFFLGLLLLQEEAWGHYLVGLPLVMLLFFSIPIYNLLKKHKVVLVFSVIILSLIMLRPDSFMQNTDKAYAKDPAVYRNYLKTIDYIYKKADGREFNYELYTPPIHDNTYKYLFSWYGEKKYGYTPSQDSKNLYFFIIEPDRPNPERIEKWLEYRKNSGDIIDSKILPGDIVIQTRMRHTQPQN